MSIFSDTWSMDILSLDLDIETVWDQSGDEFSSRNRLLDQLQVLSGDFSATAQKPSGVEARQLEIMRGRSNNVYQSIFLSFFENF